MRSFIISLTVFCAMSWTGFALKCLQCVKENSDTCEGVSVDCPNCTSCLVVSELYHSYDTKYHSIKRACNQGFPCNKVLYISNFYNKELRIYVQCCTGDNCNTDDYQMPPEQKEHLGRNCTSCYGDGMKECISNRTVKCLNKEERCLDFIGRLRDPGKNIQEHNFKGCISHLGCVHKFGGMVGVKELQTKRFKCSK